MTSFVSLYFAVGLVAGVSGTTIMGTFLEPWYTARAAYHWSFPSDPSCLGDNVQLLFGDVNGDLRDDLIRAGCGSGDGWRVSLSNGVNAWEQNSTWWHDGALASSERFISDLNGDGKADAAVFNGSFWSIAFSTGAGFSSAIHVDGSVMGCGEATSTSQKGAVSVGAIWCISEGADGTTSWGQYNMQTKSSTLQHLTRPTSVAVVQRWVKAGTAEGSLLAVLMDSDGNFFVAAQGSDGKLLPFKPALRNFTAARGADCSPDTIMIMLPSSAAKVVCANAVSGTWYSADLLQSSALIEIWKFSHGGQMGGAKAASSIGWAPGQRGWYRSYASFYLADPLGTGTLYPLACNATTQPEENTPRCCILPGSSSAKPPYFDAAGFQKDAPALKSVNANLWQAWHLQYKPLLANGEYGEYDSADMYQARFMFDKLTAAGISFYISDNTNGLGSDFGNTIAATKALAALCARYNAERTSGKIYYALAVGVNPLGPFSDPATLPVMEVQLQQVWSMFLNASDQEVHAFDGNEGPTQIGAAELAAAAYRGPSGKPLVVLYVEQGFEPLWNQWMQQNPESVGHRFHIGYADGNENWRPGAYGWMIDRSCAPPHSPDKACSDTPGIDVTIQPDKEVMYVSPAFAKFEKNGQSPQYFAYAARDLDWYRSLFPIVAQTCPKQLVVGAFNDYTENNGWWPSKCPHCTTGEEKDPMLFWNATIEGITMVRRTCGGYVQSENSESAWTHLVSSILL
mmetsp:Transcript_25406/g.72350  ORF Transcript_25406/g.72350 Transcript_25406/m.72350 type:complete len:740 (-) Transcript_25406:329-2548(-)